MSETRPVLTPVATCRIEPEIFDVYTPTTVRVRVWPRETLAAGTVIACQLSNSFYAFRISQSHTQRLQTDDPAGPAYVGVAAVSRTSGEAVGHGSSFDVEVAARELITDTDGQTRHGQRVLSTLTGGDLPAGSEIVFTFARMVSPWVANQDEYFLVSVGGTAIELGQAFFYCVSV